MCAIQYRWRSSAAFIGNLVSIRESASSIFEVTARPRTRVPSLELMGLSSSIAGQRGLEKMLSRWGCVVVICFWLAPRVEASEHSGLIHRASCSVVRFYVAKFSAAAAETWARSHGATEAEIEAARHCLNSAPDQATQAARWTVQ